MRAGVALDARRRPTSTTCFRSPDASFDAVVSRLSVMAADDPSRRCASSGRVLSPAGRLVTVLWASPAENPWFEIPREAARTVLGRERAAFARAFGRLGAPEEAAAAHRAAGLVEAEARRLHERRAAPGVAAYWAECGGERALPEGRGGPRRGAAGHVPRGARGALRALPRAYRAFAAADARPRHGSAGGRSAGVGCGRDVGVDRVWPSSLRPSPHSFSRPMCANDGCRTICP